jgi:hypothetical protein
MLTKHVFWASSPDQVQEWPSLKGMCGRCGCEPEHWLHGLDESHDFRPHCPIAIKNIPALEGKCTGCGQPPDHEIHNGGCES